MSRKTKNNKTKIILISATFLFFVFLLTSAANAMQLSLQRPFGDMKEEIEVSGSSIGEYIMAAYEFGSAVVVAVAIVMIIIGGVQWAISGGSPDSIGKAKDTIFKAFLGLFIALFSVFMLSIVNPGAVQFASITPTGIVGVADPTLEFDNTPTATCTDDLSNPCGKSYPDPYNNLCIGKECSTATQVCKEQADNSWECESCGSANATCSANRDCCSGQCSNNKCADPSTIACTLGKSCQKATQTQDCQGLICSESGFNTCMYGMSGQDCEAGKNDCAPGYYCNTEWFNKCVKKIQWGYCDPSGGSNSCPAGFSCKKLYYCSKKTGSGNIDEYAEYGCLENAGLSVKVSQYTCVPDDVKCLCQCGAWDEAKDCVGVNYNGNSAPYCNTDGKNYCSPGTYGSPCDSNDECISNICMTYSTKNQCTQGELGDGCSNDSECRSGLRCHDEDVCVPPEMLSCNN